MYLSEKKIKGKKYTYLVHSMRTFDGKVKKIAKMLGPDESRNLEYLKKKYKGFFDKKIRKIQIMESGKVNVKAIVKKKKMKKKKKMQRKIKRKEKRVVEKVKKKKDDKKKEKKRNEKVVKKKTERKKVHERKEKKPKQNEEKKQKEEKWKEGKKIDKRKEKKEKGEKKDARLEEDELEDLMEIYFVEREIPWAKGKEEKLFLG